MGSGCSASADYLPTLVSRRNHEKLSGLAKNDIWTSFCFLEEHRDVVRSFWIPFRTFFEQDGKDDVTTSCSLSSFFFWTYATSYSLWLKRSKNPNFVLNPESFPPVAELLVQVCLLQLTLRRSDGVVSMRGLRWGPKEAEAPQPLQDLFC